MIVETVGVARENMKPLHNDSPTVLAAGVSINTKGFLKVGYTSKPRLRKCFLNSVKCFRVDGQPFERDLTGKVVK